MQSTNSTSAPALIAASGEAMKVFEGQRTVSPRTPANSSAARAPPAQLESPTLGSPFHSPQRRSKASSFGPSDHCSESSTSVQRSNSRPRSRWSNPIANFVASDRVVSADPKGAARLAPRSDRSAPRRSADADPSPSCADLDHGARPPCDRRAARRRRRPIAMKATSATPPSGVVPQDSPKISGASDHRDEDLDGEHDRRHVGRRAPLQGAHLAEQGQALGGDRGRQPGGGDEQRAGRQLVGEQLAGDRRPGVAAAGAEHGEEAGRAQPAPAAGRAARSGSRPGPGPAGSPPCRRDRSSAPAPPRRRRRPRR